MLYKIKSHVLIIVALSLILSACQPSEQTLELNPVKPESTSTVSPTQSFPSLASETPSPDDEATQLMYSLVSGSDYQQAIDTILSTQDTRFIAVFIELMRANQIGVVRGAGYNVHVEVLETLSGQSFGGDWPAWVEWYGTTSLTPPPGFTGWKGKVLGLIDPEFEGFLQDDLPSVIRVEEIQWGGVKVDGIPALKNATMIPADEADYLEIDEPVFGVSVNGDHRAYPLRILDWHEMANDIVGGVPLSLAYCTLCGAGIAFDGRASNGETYTFGSSGFLFQSNKLMYDHQTRTLWNQLTGEPVLGKLVEENIKLELLPVVVTSWESWLEQHPDTLVLDINTGYQRPYEIGAAYGSYFASNETMFPVWQRSNLLETKDRIYALQVDGIPKAYPVKTLIDEQVINDVIGQTSVVLVALESDITVAIAKTPFKTYNAGGEVRAYFSEEETFRPGLDKSTVLDSAGNSWQITEEALVGPDGKLAPRVNGHLAYWFGWYSFFPKTLLYGEE